LAKWQDEMDGSGMLNSEPCWLAVFLYFFLLQFLSYIIKKALPIRSLLLSSFSLLLISIDKWIENKNPRK